MDNSWLDRKRNLIFVTVLVLAFGGAGAFYVGRPAEGPIEVIPPEAPTTASPAVSPSPTLTQVRIYITGAVVKSDVYILPKGSIIKDAILAAGGFTEEADRERINQALELKDQQHIHVSRFGEVEIPLTQPGEPGQGTGGGSPETGPDRGGVINLNTATLDQLDSLPGIGPAIAQRIIDYREQIGGFKHIDQITEVSGIGDATLAKVRDQITVE